MLTDKVAIVTGATSGIGRATASLFAANGAKVVGVGRNSMQLSELGHQSGENGGSVKPHMGDVTDVSQVDRLVAETIDEFGKIDILVNAAGIIGNGNIENTTLDEWDNMLNINLRSVFYLMQKCVPFLEKTQGNIVNVSYLSSDIPLRRCSPVTTTPGFTAFTRIPFGASSSAEQRVS